MKTFIYYLNSVSISLSIWVLIRVIYALAMSFKHSYNILDKEFWTYFLSVSTSVSSSYKLFGIILLGATLAVLIYLKKAKYA